MRLQIHIPLAVLLGWTGIVCVSHPEEVCKLATLKASYIQHLPAETVPDTPVSRVAFSSCHKPEKVDEPTLWKHMRETFRPDLFIWLGDNAYSDTPTDMDGIPDMNIKREKYNAVRDDRFYRRYGPVADPKIPVMAIWDDHDFGKNGAAVEYPCKIESQREFCVHFNISTSDVRHPDNPDISKRREGIYSSVIFPLPTPYDVGDDLGGIHVINLDTRYHRDQFDEDCIKYPNQTDMLGELQWDWLESEFLQKKSEIKLISTSIQALSPTRFNTDMEDYCAFDGEDGNFMRSVAELEEGPEWGQKEFTREEWSDIPQARLRLLLLAQKSINTGKAKVIIFLSGNNHWADFLVKRMPGSQNGGAKQNLYEIVASGIGRERDKKYSNTNRIRLRSCDTKGDSLYFNECKFPFIYKKKEYHKCTNDDVGGKRDGLRPWCFFETEKNDKRVEGKWGFCLSEGEEIVPMENQFVTRTTCGDNYHQVCTEEKYGGIVVDWEEGKVTMNIFTPTEDVVGGLASSVDIMFTPQWKLLSSTPASLNIPSASPIVTDKGTVQDTSLFPLANPVVTENGTIQDIAQSPSSKPVTAPIPTNQQNFISASAGSRIISSSMFPSQFLSLILFLL